MNPSVQHGIARWFLDQAKGYIAAFVLATATIGPLALFGAIDRQFLVLPAALGITSLFVGALLLGHRWTVNRRRRDGDG